MTADQFARFWSKVRKTPGCWEWTGAKMPYGYGAFWFGGRLARAHRASYEMHVGQIPAGLQVRHHCDNPACVRPEHLALGTYADNIGDKLMRGREKHMFNREQVLEIMSRYRAGESMRSLARAFQTHGSGIKYVLTHRGPRLTDLPPIPLRRRQRRQLEPPPQPQ